ncbi:MAG TPA: lysophospholipid acyltransferase family protein [Thermoanaerobaculia bacterium]|nr:lysophospholipid acyltransferase family protein [Thermoanaerobaculia bacterium]
MTDDPPHEPPERKRPAARAPEIAPALLGWFRRYADRYLARHFHAIRLARAGFDPAELPADRPLVVYLNHPAWWDPLLGLALAFERLPGRRHFAPIDATALARYRLLGRLGFFPVELGTRRGAAGFLATARAILDHPDAAIWMTPGGRFADPRERPVELQSGLGHLAAKVPAAIFLPLAVEYPFWEERTPEALARFGKPLDASEARLGPGEWTVLLAERLAATQDALAIEAISRDPARFETVARGKAGAGGAYDAWRRLTARVRGEKSDSRRGRNEE